jgi:subtilase family serine protease
MTLGINTSGNLQTSGRTSQSVMLGNLRNTVASTTRKFKYCNNNSPDLNFTFNCVFNGLYKPINHIFEPYHILNEQEIPLETIEIEENQQNDNTISIKSPLSLLSGPFTPAQLKKCYNVPTILPNKGIRRPIVTIITAFTCPTLTKDVSTFGRVFKLPPCNLTVFNFSRKFNPVWAAETTLNVQWVYGINPYAKIRVIQARTNSWNDMLMAIKYANNKNNFRPIIDTDIITMSFGSPDNGDKAFFNQSFTNPNIIYLAASGNSNVVSAPASCTNVISVGATSLYLNNDFTRASESVWSKTGCGFSKSFSKPFYQPSSEYSNRRTTPDVCCVGDPNTGCCVILNGKAYSIGGTSVASPSVAGMLSLVIQDRLNKRKSTYTSLQNRSNTIQPLLYNKDNYNCFFDITEGKSGQYVATEGYDIPSGLGSFNCARLINKLG